MIKAPCRDCTDRHTGCHGTCDRYREYAKAKSEEREKYWRARLSEQEVESYVIHAKGKNAKSKNLNRGKGKQKNGKSYLSD